MTEISASCFLSKKDDNENQTTETVGFLLDHLEAKVTNEQGLIVPFGTPGELCVRGYSTMLGYFDDPQKTKETISSDRWLRTGLVEMSVDAWDMVDATFSFSEISSYYKKMAMGG